jgi:hypothetical protein
MLDMGAGERAVEAARIEREAAMLDLEEQLNAAKADGTRRAERADIRAADKLARGEKMLNFERARAEAAARVEAAAREQDMLDSTDKRLAEGERALAAERAAGEAAAATRVAEAERTGAQEAREAATLRARVDELVAENARLHGAVSASEVRVQELGRMEADLLLGGRLGTFSSASSAPPGTPGPGARRGDELHGPLGGSFTKHILLLRGVEEALHGAKAALAPSEASVLGPTRSLAVPSLHTWSSRLPPDWNQASPQEVRRRRPRAAAPAPGAR